MPDRLHGNPAPLALTQISHWGRRKTGSTHSAARSTETGGCCRSPWQPTARAMTNEAASNYEPRARRDPAAVSALDDEDLMTTGAQTNNRRRVASSSKRVLGGQESNRPPEAAPSLTKRWTGLLLMNLSLIQYEFTFFFP